MREKDVMKMGREGGEVDAIETGSTGGRGRHGKGSVERERKKERWRRGPINKGTPIAWPAVAQVPTNTHGQVCLELYEATELPGFMPSLCKFREN